MLSKVIQQQITFLSTSTKIYYAIVDLQETNKNIQQK
jgi:hypothetical protein